MTYDERQQSICQQCGRGDTCGYVSRNLVRKCEYNSAVMQGWELGQEDAIEAFENNRLAACDHQTAEEAQREQDFATAIIEQEHRHPTFDDAIKYGMRLQRELMMEEAVEAEVYVDEYNLPFVHVDDGLKLFYRIKFIIIKED